MSRQKNQGIINLYEIIKPTYLKTKILFNGFVVLCAIVIGCMVRYPYILSSDFFPLGDGGLFIAMIEALESNHYLLPETVQYNAQEIPFAYPPLGFYLAGYIAKYFQISILVIARWLPLLLNFFTIIAFVFLSSEIFHNKIELVISSILFPVIFQGYEWLIKAGGITRSAGFLFLVITLYFLCKHQKEKRVGFLVLGTVFLSLTILSHPEWGMIAVIFAVIYLLTINFSNLKNQFFVLFILGAGTLLLTSAWWGIVLIRFGITPFLMANQAILLEANQFFDVLRGGIFLITVTSSSNVLIPWLAILGVVVAVYKKEYFVPLWLLFVYLITPRNIAVFGIIPVVFLVVYGLRGINEFVFRWISQLKLESKQVAIRSIFSRFPLNYLYIGMILFVTIFERADLPIVQPILQSDRMAMKFIRENTLVEEKFVVITTNNWYNADSAEWFPYLTQRESLTTPQGIEWVSAVEFREIANIVAYLSGLARSERSSYETNEIIDYVEAQFSDFDYVAVFIGNVYSEFGGFINSGRYNLIYEKKDVLIFKRLE